MYEVRRYLIPLSTTELNDAQWISYMLIYTLVTLSGLCVALRTYSRIYIVLKFGLDDLFIVAAMLGNLFCMYCQLVQLCGGEGVGLPFPKVGHERYSVILKGAYVHLIVHIPTVGLIKLSYLAFYRRLSVDQHFQLTLKVLAVIISLFTISMTFLNIFYLCRPVEHFWNPHTFPDPNHCANIVSIVGTQTLFAIVSDITILLLPVPSLMKLRLPLRRKLGLYLIFGVGTLATCSSIYKVYTLVVLDLEADRTVNGTAVLNPKIVEPNLAIIASCFPGIKPIFWKLNGWCSWVKRGGSSRRRGEAASGRGRRGAAMGGRSTGYESGWSRSRTWASSISSRSRNSLQTGAGTEEATTDSCTSSTNSGESSKSHVEGGGT